CWTIGPERSPGSSFGSGCAGLAGLAAAGLADFATAGLAAWAGTDVPPDVDAGVSPEAAAAACSLRVADCLLMPTAVFALSMALCRPAWPGAVADAGDDDPEPLFGRRMVNRTPTRATT